MGHMFRLLLPLLILKDEVSILLDRNRLQKAKLDWKVVFLLSEEEVPLKLKELLAEFDSILKDFKMKLPVDKTATS